MILLLLTLSAINYADKAVLGLFGKCGQLLSTPQVRSARLRQSQVMGQTTPGS